MIEINKLNKENRWNYKARVRLLKNLRDQGDGIRSFVAVMGSLVVSKHSLFLIDEPETFLHPPQARLIGNNILTKEELEIVKWGRNAKGTKNKSTDIVTYRLATGLEALIGKLYFENKNDRIKEIMNFILGD